MLSCRDKSLPGASRALTTTKWKKSPEIAVPVAVIRAPESKGRRHAPEKKGGAREKMCET